MIVQHSGAIQPFGEAMRKEPKATRAAVFVESSGMMQNMPVRSDEKGPVADALHNAKAELDNQISEQVKAKSDTDLALERAIQDKAQKEAELKEALRLYNYWLNKHRQLQDAIQNVSSKISDLTN